jgi:hypothetical protein
VATPSTAAADGAAEADAVLALPIPASAVADTDRVPTADGVPAEQALKAPEPVAVSSPRSRVRLRMVAILRGGAVMTSTFARANDHTARAAG